MKLIVGLGNPGKKYECTRHNIGFLVVDALQKHDFKTRFLKPDTFMNESGKAVSKAMSQTNFTPQDILVIHDDADLAFGEMRLRTSRSSGGHRGMQSVIDALGTQDIPRLRIGIGRSANPEMTLEDFVLQSWTKEEEAELPSIIENACVKIESLFVA